MRTTNHAPVKTLKAARELAASWTASTRNKKAICKLGREKYLVCSQMTQRKHGYEVVERV